MLLSLITFTMLNLKQYSAFKGFIAGGVSADIQNFPHVVYLAAESEPMTFICGSSVLNQKILLTAAHCVAAFNNITAKFMAFAGSHDIRQPRSIRFIQHMILHEAFDGDTLANDIGLVKLKKPLTLGKFLKRSVLPQVFPTNVTTGVIAGWGVIDDIIDLSTKQLQYLEQTIKSEPTCDMVSGYMSGVFCAGSLTTGDPRPAIGDSGSAFTVHKYLQIGILSFRPHDFKSMSVYTNITFFYKWIKNHVKRLYCTS